MTDFTDIDAARAQANSEGQTAVGLQSELPTLADKLGTALKSRLENPEMQQRNEAVTNFINMGPGSRQNALQRLTQEGQPADPLAVEGLVSKMRGTALLPIMNLNSIIQSKMGGIEDTIQKGVGAFQSLVAAAQGRRGLAQENLQSLMQQAQMEEQRRQFDAQMAQARESTPGFSEMVDLGNRVAILDKNGKEISSYDKGKLPSSASGSGDGAIDWSKIFPQVTEKKPSAPPSGGSSSQNVPQYTPQKVGTKSGNYIYTGSGSNGGWEFNWGAYGL